MTPKSSKEKKGPSARVDFYEARNKLLLSLLSFMVLVSHERYQYLFRLLAIYV